MILDRYDDGGYSGGSMERPALQALLEAVRAKRIDVIAVYKVDRLTRSLADFVKLVELFDEEGVSFVSVTQSFNTTTSMGRLTLNMVLSFAQFEREVTGERIRDKIAADGKGKSTGGGLISRGHLYKILRNPIYVGRLGHNDLVHEGQKAAIVDQTTWECVQNRLAAHAQRETQASQHNSDALMAGGCSTIAGI